MKPFDPRLLVAAKSARWFIAGIAMIAIGNTALIACFAWQISHFISDVFVSGKTVGQALPSLTGAALAGLGRAALVWLQDWLGGLAAARVKMELRTRLLDSVISLGPDWVAERGSSSIRSLLTKQLDAIDSYIAKFLPQLVYATIVTPAFVVGVFTLDAISGWSLALTLPLVPIFMVLIGWATQNVQKRQLDALSRLTTHFSEAIRGLTTLRVFNRAENQVQGIAKSSEQYQKRTMKVLRISFLSGFALELVASLSVALIAVSIGLRLVNGSLGLGVGLFVLLLAPEAYLPLRMVGSNFHVSSEGVEASKATLDIIDASDSAAPFEASAANFVTPVRGRLIVVTGPSGSGKSTALRALRNRIGLTEVAWLPQNLDLLEGSLLANVVGPVVKYDQPAFLESLRLAALDDLPLEYEIGEDARRVSRGQAQRIGLARAIYAALAGARQTVLLDEPVSAQDTVRAGLISESLADLASRGFAIVAVSHQPIHTAHKTVEMRNA